MNIFEKWSQKATRYVDVRFQLVKLGIIERASNVLGTLISMLVILFLGLAFMIFLGLSLMEFFISLLDNRTGGCLLTAAFFALLIGIVVLMRKKVINAFAGIFIKIMTDTDDEDEHERKVKVEGDDDDE